MLVDAPSFSSVREHVMEICGKLPEQLSSPSSKENNSELLSSPGDDKENSKSIESSKNVDEN